MIFELDTTGTIEGLKETISKITSDPEVNALVIVACSENEFTPEQVDPIIKSLELPLMGGVFPAIMVNHNIYKKGTVIWGVKRTVTICKVENISSEDEDITNKLEESLQDSIDNKALQIVFVDGFSKRIGALTSGLHELIGLTSDTVGGGAGSLDFVQRPCLFTNDGMKQDAAVIATVSGRAGVGVAHGWTKIGGPYRVTESEQNTIISLDWRPAFEVYKEIVEAHSDQKFTDDNFFDIAKAYPFGLARLDGEHIVRDPLMVEGKGSLVCVGEVNTGEHVDILNGNTPSLLAAAGDARKIADDYLDGAPQIRIFMDCISRVLFLDNEFETEIAAVKHDDNLLLGICTIGEIANHGDEFVEFYNKTSVVASLASSDS